MKTEKKINNVKFVITSIFSVNFAFGMKIYYTILSVLLAAYMLVAPVAYNAQATDRIYSPIQKVNNLNFDVPALAVAAFSFKTAPTQNFLWVVFLFHSIKYQLDTCINFLSNKEGFLLKPFLRSAIYVYVTINAP